MALLGMALMRRMVSITACDIWYQILEGCVGTPRVQARVEAGVCLCQVCPGVSRCAWARD